MPELTIKPDDLRDPRVIALLAEHMDNMLAITPPESVHALDLEALRHPSIRFWSVWSGETLAGCGALKALADHQAEIKSMRTVRALRGQGVASQLLEFIMDEARSRGVTQLFLETGRMAEFAPARALYLRYGFCETGPFADYHEDPNSVFMTRAL